MVKGPKQEIPRMGFLSIVFILVFLLSIQLAHSFEKIEQISEKLNDAGITIHGFASAGYLDSNHHNFLAETEDGSVDFNEFGINFTKSFTNDLRLGFQLYSFDLGDIGDHKVSLDWGFLDYHWKEWLGIRLGRVKMPYGLYNEQQDYDMLRTSILLPQGIYSKYQRESIINYNGIGAYGNFSIGELGKLGYDIFYGTAKFESDGGIAKILSENGRELESSDMDWTSGGRIKWYTPVKGLLLSSTYFRYHLKQKLSLTVPGFGIFPIETDMPDGETFIVSAEYSLCKFTAAAEYLQMNVDANSTTYLPGFLGGTTKTESEFRPDSFYAKVSYRFTDWFEAGAYYSVFYADRHDRAGHKEAALYGTPDYNSWQKDLTISTRFDITENWLFKLEFHIIDGVALTTAQDNPTGWDHRKWEMLAIKTTFNF